MSIAFLFPGQGSQCVGMGKDVYDRHEAARATFNEARHLLDRDLIQLCFEGPKASLDQTAYTQPAILVTSIAILRSLETFAGRAAYVAGHSLGEYTALVASGAMEFTDAVLLVHKRGQWMQEAVPVGEGAMAAVVGLDRVSVEAICRETSGGGEVVVVANLNTSDQIVISGTARAVDIAGGIAKGLGARMVIPLPVSVPSHSPLMNGVCTKLADAFESIRGGALKVPLINNVEARVVHTWEEAKSGLTRQVAAPLLWGETIRQMVGLGVDLFVEIGPGKVLSNLLRRTVSGVTGLHVENSADIERLWHVMEEREKKSCP